MFLQLIGNTGAKRNRKSAERDVSELCEAPITYPYTYVQFCFLYPRSFSSCFVFYGQLNAEKQIEKLVQNIIFYVLIMLFNAPLLFMLRSIIFSVVIKTEPKNDDAWRRFVWWLPCSYTHILLTLLLLLSLHTSSLCIMHKKHSVFIVRMNREI